MQNPNLNPEVTNYFKELSRSSNKSQLFKGKLESINNKYSEALSIGKYDMNVKQSKDNGQDKQKLPQEIGELTKQLQKLEKELSWAERERKQLALAKQMEDEKKGHQAVQLVDRLKRERLEFKKKMKMIDVENRLKQKAHMEMIKLTHEEIEKSRILQRKQILQSRIKSIHQKGIHRVEQMQTFEKRYVSYVKDLINSNKRLHERLEEQNQRRQRQEQERVQRLLRQQAKKETDWSLIRRHEVSYVQLAKHYHLHKDTSFENEFLGLMKKGATRSNKHLKRFQYQAPPVSKRKIATEVPEEQEPSRKRIQLTRQERFQFGNRFLEQSLAMIDRNKGRSRSDAPSIKEQSVNYIPQVKDQMRECLKSIAHRLSTEIQTSKNNSPVKDQSYNKRMLENIHKLDSIIQKKNLLAGKLARSPSEADILQDQENTSLLVKNIKSKLTLLNDHQ